MQDKLNTKIFYIGDQSFTANMDYVKNFCIASKKENLVWSCQTRVNLVNEEIAKTMKNAGCLEVCFGAESYNQKILNLNNKMTKVSEIPKALSICKKKGLNTHTYWLCGLPGESRTSAKKTITAIESLITKKLSDMAGYFIVVPYPGTDIFNNPQKYGIKIISRDFSLYKEDQKPVMETEYLKSNEIYDIWKKGLSRIANALEKTV